MGETILDYLFYFLEEYDQLENYRKYFKTSPLNRLNYRLKVFFRTIRFDQYISDKSKDIWNFSNTYPGVPKEFKQKIEYYVKPN